MSSRRSRWVAIEVAGLLLISTLIASTPSAAAEPGVPACAPSVAELAFAQLARKANSFQSDSTYIDAVSCAPHIFPSNIGVPLTASESAEIERRTTTGEALHKIDQQEQIAAPDRYVGSWIDPLADGKATFAYVGGATAGDTARVASSLPPGTPTSFSSGLVARLRQLSVSSYIKANFAALWDSGIQIVGSYDDPRSGAVTIGLSSKSDSDAETRLLSAIGSGGVSVKSSAPDTWVTTQDVRTQPTGRQYGGAYISSTSNNSECTSSPSASSPAGFFYTVTAGHCGHPGYSWVQGNSLNTNYPLGTGQGNALYAATGTRTTDCDCQGIGPISASKQTSGTYVDNNALFKFTRSANGPDYFVGRTLCFSGGTEYETYGHDLCGHIVSVVGQFTETPNGVSVLVTNLIQTDFNTTLNGDSGGPYGDGTVWLGTHLGIGNCSIGTCSTFSASVNVASNPNVNLTLQNLGY